MNAAPRPIRKLLVANRGEIAIRVIRAAHDLGIRTVAVYSDADRTSLHVRGAYEAYRLGPPEPRASYLNVEAILAAARKSGADAVHPGYGFLSENARFARAVEEAGLVFVGPPASAMEQMGDKVSARKTVTSHGVPVVPGTTLEDASEPERIEAAARSVGFPLLVKAAFGGGGKGMRLVREVSEVVEAVRRASSEAETAFGDGLVYLERFVEEPRHVEIQVLADRHGTTLAVGERECSVQRRHQKVVEESPSPVVTEEMRHAMETAAVDAAKACGYVSAGTVEFLVGADRQFHFLEMNTRIQVEHPITELRYGVDLVKEQIRIAEGHAITFRKEDLRSRGHAIEARICAEDADAGFLPSTGTLGAVQLPGGPGRARGRARVRGPARDAPLRQPARQDRRARRRPRSRDPAAPPRPSRDAPLRPHDEHPLRAARARRPALHVGHLRHLDRRVAPQAAPRRRRRGARRGRGAGPPPARAEDRDPRAAAHDGPLPVGPGRPRVDRGAGPLRYYVTVAGRERAVEVRQTKAGLEVLVDGVPHPADVASVEGTGLYSLIVDGNSHAYALRFEDGEAVLSFHDHDVALRIEDERTRLARLATGTKRGGQGPAEVRSVMPGVVKEVRVAEGARVEAGEPLLILEAMKMENEIRAPRAGTVRRLHVGPGQAVEKGAALVRLEPDAPAT